MKPTHALLIALGFSSGSLVAGCASTAVTPDQVGAPKAAIAAAEEAGADENPTASLHLKLANDQFAAASRLIKDGNDARARLVLDRAAADAELALALAHRDGTRQEARDAMKGIEDLRKQHRLLEGP